MSVEAIKKALEGVTPGPWEVYSEKVADKAAAIAESAYQVEHTEPFVGEIFMLNGGGKCPAMTGCGPCSEANARYIAAVNPAAISELLSTLDGLQRENAALKIDASNHAADAETVRREREVERRRAEAAEANVARLREQLEWYGEQARLARLITSEGDKGRNAISADGGARARATLASTGGEHHADK